MTNPSFDGIDMGIFVFGKYVRCGLFAALVVVFMSASNLNAQNIPKYNLKDVVVTASRTPLSFSDLTRNVIVLGPEEIKNAPVNSVQGLLKYALGVGLEERGVDGVQSDVTIRGGSFEETLIMIDGVSINDPQTGHHNLNLPVPLEDVERIEILKGPGSSIYGADAFSGIINIITKKGYGKSLSLQTEGGQNGYYSGSAYGAYSVGNWNNHIALSKQKSDGYMHNTDFDIVNFSYGTSLNTNLGALNLFYGYNDKKFGANGFYSTLFPNQWEHTTTKLLSLSGDLGNSNIIISPKAYWRRNDDNYLLDYINPSFYHNIHQTNVYGIQLQASVLSGIGTTSFGGEYTTDKIKSNNLGNHSRDRKGVFAEQKFSPLTNLTVIANAFAYDYSTIGWKFWPGIDMAYNVMPDLRLFGSIGKAFRIPTYTELYYSSPASMGNPDLKYEETLNFEIGMNLSKAAYNLKASLFRKEGKNLIDWVRSSESQPWTARNIAALNTNGFEIDFAVRTDKIVNGLPVNRINIGYTYLSSNKNTEQFESQYLLDYMRHQLLAEVDNSWSLGIKQNWEIRYENRVNFKDSFVVDTQLYKNFEDFKVYIKATNLFNESFSEISGVPMPGRWITTGVKFNVGN